MVGEDNARWRRRKEVRPAEIVEAALTLFVERGFKATKMEDIAQAAGVTKGTPYLYFQNKEDLLRAVVRDSLVARVAGFEQMLEQHRGSYAELMERMLVAWWQSVGSTSLAGLCKLMIAEAANFPELARFYHQEIILRSRAVLTELLRRGMACGEFREAPLEAAVDTLISPLLITMIWSHSFGRIPGCEAYRGDPTPHLRATLQLVLQGLQNK